MRANLHISEIRAMNCSSAAVINIANVASFSITPEKKAHNTLSVHFSTTNRRCRARFIKTLATITSDVNSFFRVRFCKAQDLNKPSIKELYRSSSLSSSSSSSSSRPPWTLTFDYPIRQNHGHVCLRHQCDLKVVRVILERVNAMKLMLNDSWVSQFKQFKNQRWGNFTAGRKGVLGFIIAVIFLTTPTIMLTNGSISISDSIAIAQPIGQIRQAAVFLERLAEGSTSAKVLDKVMTVISGQTVVTPETVERLKSVIDGKDYKDWQTDLENNAESFWSTTIDVVSNFNPLSLIESAGTSIQGLVEVGAERFAAFELSTLVALGERWLLWTPFVVIPMYWQMSRNRSKDDSNGARGKPGAAAVELSEEAVAKAARVREELERIELKASLLDMVYSLGKLAWQSSKTDQDLKRKQIDEILARLQELNPAHSFTSSDLGSALVRATQNEELPYNQSALDVDGDWILIYVSQASDQSQQTQLPQFLNLDFLGVELSNMRQKVWRKGSRTSVPTLENEAGELMMAKNTAQVRLGPLGVVELSVQGSWENLLSGKGALVTFHTFSARPIEVLGTLIREDIPPLDVSIPRTLQTSGEWEIVYLDNSIRINRGKTGQFYLFRKAQ